LSNEPALKDMERGFSQEMKDLFSDICACKGYDNCYGKAIGKVNPIVFRIDPSMRIMVITEQPREGSNP
jgi:uracil-DNA glycosylase